MIKNFNGILLRRVALRKSDAFDSIETKLAAVEDRARKLETKVAQLGSKKNKAQPG